MQRLETLYDLFPEQSRDAIKSLSEDSEFQKQLPALVLERIEKSANRVLPIESDMLPLFFSRAGFAESEEIYKMANLFGRYFSHRGGFLPLAIDYLGDLEKLKRDNRSKRSFVLEGEDFASRCLFSLSLFYEALNKLYSNKGAPHPEFYREVGKRTFASVGEDSIAENFDRWEEFIRENAFS
jgi:hypothetical protein